MERAQPETHRRLRLFLPLLVFALAALVFSFYGLRRSLTREDASYLYGAQRLVDGVPPYLGIVDLKGPMAQILPALGVIVARAAGWSDLAASRILFLVLGSLAVVSVFYLGKTLFQSHRAALLAALTFLGFAPFGARAASGPSAKIPMVLFETLCLLFTCQRRWFLAGLTGALSALIWQPTAIFPAAALFLAATQPRAERWPAIARVLGGIGLLLLPTGAYFALHGALDDMLNATVLFQLRYRELPSLITAVSDSVFALGRVVLVNYHASLMPIFIGLATVVYMLVARAPFSRSVRDLLSRDPFAPILVTFPIPLLYSVMDFQGASDFYWILPYVAIGFGKFLDLAARTAETEAVPAWTRRLFVPGVSIALLTLAFGNTIAARDSGLDAQERAAFEIEHRLGKDTRLLVVDAPEVLVLLRRVNPTRYVRIGDDIDRMLDATTPGGFSAWIRGLEAYRPDVIVFKKPPRLQGYRRTLVQWMESGYRGEQVGAWTVYARRDGN